MKARFRIHEIVQKGGVEIHRIPSGRVLWASLFRMLVLTSPDMTCAALFSLRRHARVLAVTNRYHFDASIRITISHPSCNDLQHRVLTQKEPSPHVECFPNVRALPY